MRGQMEGARMDKDKIMKGQRKDEVGDRVDKAKVR